MVDHQPPGRPYESLVFSLRWEALVGSRASVWPKHSKGRGRSGGGMCVENWFGKVMGDVRRAMSVQVVRSQALCLLERLSQLGPGARAAGDRRKVIQRIEETRKRQAQAYRLAHRNRGLCRVGRAFVP